METLRPFEDLINEIEFDGEKFIPIEKIVALAFNYNENAVKYEAKMWINHSYDYAAHYMFETKILEPKSHKCSVVIFKNFDIWIYHKIDNNESNNTGIPASNQVEIVKNIIKWGFIKN